MGSEMCIRDRQLCLFFVLLLVLFSVDADTDTDYDCDPDTDNDDYFCCVSLSGWKTMRLSAICTEKVLELSTGDVLLFFLSW